MTQALFLEMLEFQRPAGNPYEEAFINRYIKPLGPHVDDFGNQIIDVGSKPDIIWSSHTDTVHDKGGLQQIEVTKKGVARVPKKSKSNCLGADCTTGVYIMVEMIKAGIEGRYIFHRAEEIGCLGSKHILKNTPDLLKGISAAVAFDRMGNNEVITHQGSQTASKKFAESFAKELTGYAPSSRGAYTDTKTYASVIPECTNIGVGYGRQHSESEFQDLKHLTWLVDKMTKFSTTGLEIARDPSVQPVTNWGFEREPQNVYDLVWQEPRYVALWLIQQGVTFEELAQAVDGIKDAQRAKLFAH